MRVQSTPYFVRQHEGLRQVVQITPPTDDWSKEAALVTMEGEGYRDQFTVSPHQFLGDIIEVSVPPAKQTVTYRVSLKQGDREPLIGTVDVSPARQWDIYVVHHSHLDIGYTDPQPRVARNHLTYLDQVLTLCRMTDDWPEEARFKWQIEVTWPLKLWLESRPKAAIDEMMQRIKEGRVEVAGAYLNMHTDAYGLDELLETFRFTGELRRKYGIDIESAMQTDIPGHTLAFLDALISGDIKYLSLAHNYAGRSRPDLTGGDRLERPFYWASPRGGRVLVWYTDTPHGFYMEGNHARLHETLVDASTEGVLKTLNQLQSENYPYNELHLRIQGGFVDNAGPNIRIMETIKAWNERYAYPRLRTATNVEFFRTMESKYADRFPTFTGDWGDWWVDGIGSAAFENGLNRMARARLAEAETLHSILASETDAPYPVEEAKEAREAMVLFDEHTWGAGNPWNARQRAWDSGAWQWHHKLNYALKADEGANQLLDDALARWQTHLEAHQDETASTSRATDIAVFNQLSWPRTDVVRVFVPEGVYREVEGVRVIDPSTGAAVPCVVETQDQYSPQPRGFHVTFVAKDVPAVGYKRYRIEPAERTPSEQIETNGVIENDFYKIEVDQETGAIRSVMDKDLSHELVDQNAPYGLNGYIYDRYTSAPHYNHLSARMKGGAELLLGARKSLKLVSVDPVQRDAVKQTLRVRAQAPGCDAYEYRIHLYHDIKRIEIENRLEKQEIHEKESLYLSFPFNVPQGKLRYEIPGYGISLDDETVPGGCEHMKAIQHWVTAANDQMTVLWGTLEAPLVQFNNVRIPYDPFEKSLPEGEATTIYSWAHNNMWDTNFPPAQRGEMYFRYAIASHDGPHDSVRAFRHGAQLTSPLFGVHVEHISSELEQGFIELDQESVQVVTVRQDDRGLLLVRLLEVAGEEVDVNLKLRMGKWSNAWKENALGERVETVSLDADGVSLSMGAHEVVTVCFEPSER